MSCLLNKSYFVFFLIQNLVIMQYCDCSFVKYQCD